MNITITINNATSEALDHLAKMPGFTSNMEVDFYPTQVQDAPIITPQADPQDTALRIASVADIDNYLDVGTEVHWKGQKYAFDGVVERISDDVFDTDGDLQYDVKAIFIRRNDTDKLVSLTLRDLQTGRLTLID